MMTHSTPDTDALLEQASQGDDAARQQLLVRHQARLRQMIQVRLDPRLLARLDPSDVLQDVLLEANQKLDDYLRERPLAFYPWLRQLAWDKLVELQQRHIQTQKRSVKREARPLGQLPDESALELARRLLATGTSPSHQLLRKELRRQVQDALALLKEQDREVLVLRYLEQLPLREIADVLGVSEGAIKVRHLRALDRLRRLLGDDLWEGKP
jgi:RNA polymerase sigma-70 factor (ECF subfamily)